MTRPMRWIAPWVESSLAATLVVVAAFATGCAAHSSAKSDTGVASPYVSTDTASAALGLSVGEGPPGTVVTLHAARCLPRGSKPDEIVWKDSSFTFKPGHMPKGGQEVGHIVRSGNDLQATFTLPMSAPPGDGFFVTYCGPKSLWAEAGFTVDAP